MSPGLGFGGGDAVIVTGGGSGIGAAVARAAAANGVAVAIWDKDDEAAHRVVSELSGAANQALAIGVDVSVHDQVTSAMEATLAWGTPNMLVNNAGPPSAVETTFAAGTSGVLKPLNIVTDTWLNGVGERASSMVSVASVAGVAWGVGPLWYQTAKAGITGFTKGLATESRHGIRVNAVAPGIITTPRVKEILDSDYGRRMVDRIPRGVAGTPEEIADVIIFLLSPMASFVNGVTLVADGGAHLSL